MADSFVAVVTPVLNGAAHLAECVQSVRDQTYRHWVHVIVDNCSDDETAALAESLAAEDDRLRVVRGDQRLEMMANWNRAMTHADDAPYIKHLNADDTMRPGCLQAMVDAAERYPEAAIISSYFQFGPRTLPTAHHSDILEIPGTDVVRNLFLGGPDYLGQPSVLLLRRAAADAWPNLFVPRAFPPGHPDSPPLCQGDKEAYLPILRNHSLVFVPTMLSDIRKEMATATGYSSRVAAWHPGWLELLLRQGDAFLGRWELTRAVSRMTAKYVRSLTWRFIKGTPWRDNEFARYQKLALAHIVPALRAAGHPLAAAALTPFTLLLGALRKPKSTASPKPRRHGKKGVTAASSIRH